APLHRALPGRIGRQRYARGFDFGNAPAIASAQVKRTGTGTALRRGGFGKPREIGDYLLDARRTCEVNSDYCRRSIALCLPYASSFDRRSQETRFTYLSDANRRRVVLCEWVKRATAKADSDGRHRNIRRRARLTAFR